MKLGQKIDLDNNDRNRRVWFMSDLHYNHENILWINKKTRGDKFGNLTEMNDYIISELTSKINPEDIVFDLGDTIWKENNEAVSAISALLPVRSYRVFGNHDNTKNTTWGKTWILTADLLDLIIKKNGEDIQLTLSHYPLLDWNHRFRGSINLHGHTHGNIDELNKTSGELRIDIGFDSSLAQEIGSFLIPFEVVFSKMRGITGGKKFRDFAYEKNRNKTL